MNLGVLVVGIIVFLALTGMGCILIDSFLIKKHYPTAPPNLVKKFTPVLSKNFMEDFDSESFSVIINDE